jgi:hypothetical protein
MKRLVIAACLAAAPALAATPASWSALDRAAHGACSREIARLASKAKIEGTAGKVSGIGGTENDDRFYGLLLTGKTAGFRSQWLCLYDKRMRKAVARDVEK